MLLTEGGYLTQRDCGDIFPCSRELVTCLLPQAGQEATVKNNPLGAQAFKK